MDGGLRGHWHEFSIGNNELNHCYIISDSTVNTNKYTLGGIYKIKNANLSEVAKPMYYKGEDLYETIYTKDTIQFNDSIIWVKQKNDIETFVCDFSAGLKLNIAPFETNSINFDLEEKDINMVLYVGKVKKHFLEESESVYSIQLNDKLAPIDKVLEFLLCIHCDNKSMNIAIKMDKNTPVSFIKKLENEIIGEGIFRRNQIYYLVINPKKKIHGYNNYY